jgi:hypothetical protein
MTTQSFAQTVAVTTSLGTTEAFRYTDGQWGRILLPSVANTSLTFYECDTIDGTYSLCSDAGTSGVLTVPTAVSAPQSIAIPSVLIGSRFIKMVANVGAVTATVVTKTQ